MSKLQIQAKVFALYPMPNSVNGNPRYRMATSEGTFVTSSDRAYCYGIKNGWTDEHNANGRLAKLTLTRSGRVDQLQWV